MGYSTCHWCHVMERESFEDEEIGKILSKNFVCIKVDREERPDVDKVYMTFVQVCTSRIHCCQRHNLQSVVDDWNMMTVFWSGNQWWWWLANECVAHTRPQAIHRWHLLSTQRQWKKTWTENGAFTNYRTSKSRDFFLRDSFNILNMLHFFIYVFLLHLCPFFTLWKTLVLLCL